MSDQRKKWIGGKEAGDILNVGYQTVRRWSEENRVGVQLRYNDSPNGRRKYLRSDVESIAKDMLSAQSR